MTFNESSISHVPVSIGPSPRARLLRGGAVLALAFGLAPLTAAQAQDDATPSATERTTANPSTLYQGGAPVIAEPTPGEISIVAYGSTDLFEIPVIIVNGTDEAVEDVELTVTIAGSGGGDGTPVAGDGVPDDSVAVDDGTPAADATPGTEDGSEAGAVTGRSLGFAPDEIGPGEIAIGSITFDGADVPAGAELVFAVETLPVRDANTDEVDVTLSDVTYADGTFTGTATNETGVDIPSAVSVRAVCIDTDGSITGYESAYLGETGLAPDASQPFEVTLRPAPDACDDFLVAGQGRNF